MSGPGPEQNIKIVGCGGVGINMINRLAKTGIMGVETIAIDIDRQHLDYIRADKKVLMKKPPIRGFISSSWPTFGKQAAELSVDLIAEALGDASLVFIVAGLGGSTATGAIPVITQLAWEKGAIVIVVAGKPLKLEKVRLAKAEECFSQLVAETDMLIVLDNQQLLEHIIELQPDILFAVMDRTIVGMIREMVEAIADPGKADITPVDASTDYADIAIMMSGETGRAAKYAEIARKAMNRVELTIRAGQTDLIPGKDRVAHSRC